jgi:hypothetical protein
MSDLYRPESSKRRTLRWLLAIASILVCPLAFAQGLLEVKGSLVIGRSFTLHDFAELSQSELTEIRAIGTGQHQETAQVKWRGVLLRDGLNAVNFREKERRDFRRTVIVTRTRDGYLAVFSWGELYNTSLALMFWLLPRWTGSRYLNPTVRMPCLPWPIFVLVRDM